MAEVEAAQKSTTSASLVRSNISIVALGITSEDRHIRNFGISGADSLAEFLEIDADGVNGLTGPHIRQQRLRSPIYSCSNEMSLLRIASKISSTFVLMAAALWIEIV